MQESKSASETMLWNVLCPRIVPCGVQVIYLRFTVEARKRVFVCKVHSAKDRCRAGDLRGRVNGKQNWEILLNYVFWCKGNRICGNTNGTAIDDIQP
jgi:hypothetical protein